MEHGGTAGGGTVSRVRVAEYGDVAARTDIERRDIDAVVRALNGGDRPVLVVDEWLVEDKDLVPIEGAERVYQVSVRRESAKAWLVATGDTDDWVPKSCSTLLERESGVDAIDTPAATLSEFGGGA